ncbi:hypothetical protein T03_13967 [Trichinella britovi]|uniref:Uncharacterized protein n=2 Tax=Trichinella TaxID=6333 RepID=A0A0V1CMJ4_TRIBR|nr:hypothetical protein T05_11727 [Trichinella murrelli]KRY50490.1 hypothetical protein T03_13967 [Trichinella britovi]KRZ83103.1 hypothetical protein T08_11426 [Trichinella sp. T8]
MNQSVNKIKIKRSSIKKQSKMDNSRKIAKQSILSNSYCIGEIVISVSNVDDDDAQHNSHNTTYNKIVTTIGSISCALIYQESYKLETATIQHRQVLEVSTENRCKDRKASVQRCTKIAIYNLKKTHLE